MEIINFDTPKNALPIERILDRIELHNEIFGHFLEKTHDDVSFEETVKAFSTRTPYGKDMDKIIREELNKSFSRNTSLRNTSLRNTSLRNTSMKKRKTTKDVINFKLIPPHIIMHEILKWTNIILFINIYFSKIDKSDRFESKPFKVGSKNITMGKYFVIRPKHRGKENEMEMDIYLGSYPGELKIRVHDYFSSDGISKPKVSFIKFSELYDEPKSDSKGYFIEFDLMNTLLNVENFIKETYGKTFLQRSFLPFIKYELRIWAWIGERTFITIPFVSRFVKKLNLIHNCLFGITQNPERGERTSLEVYDSTQVIPFLHPNGKKFLNRVKDFEINSRHYKETNTFISHLIRCKNFRINISSNYINGFDFSAMKNLKKLIIESYSVVYSLLESKEIKKDDIVFEDFQKLKVVKIKFPKERKETKIIFRNLPSLKRVYMSIYPYSNIVDSMNKMNYDLQNVVVFDKCPIKQVSTIGVSGKILGVLGLPLHQLELTHSGDVQEFDVVPQPMTEFIMYSDVNQYKELRRLHLHFNAPPKKRVVIDSLPELIECRITYGPEIKLPRRDVFVNNCKKMTRLEVFYEPKHVNVQGQVTVTDCRSLETLVLVNDLDFKANFVVNLEKFVVISNGYGVPFEKYIKTIFPKTLEVYIKDKRNIVLHGTPSINKLYITTGHFKYPTNYEYYEVNNQYFVSDCTISNFGVLEKFEFRDTRYFFAILNISKTIFPKTEENAKVFSKYKVKINYK